MENNKMNSQELHETKSFFNQISELAKLTNDNLHLTNQKIQNTTELINKAGNVYIESKKIDNDNLRLKNELATIVSDFKTKQVYLQAIFNERSSIINKHFEVIDKGLRENNDNLVLQGLRSASEFVSTNPLDDFDNFRSILLDKNAPLELDF